MRPIAILGTLLALAGLILMLANRDSSVRDNDFAFGAVLVISGLLLRLEAAITWPRK